MNKKYQKKEQSRLGEDDSQGAEFGAMEKIVGR